MKNKQLTRNPAGQIVAFDLYTEDGYGNYAGTYFDGTDAHRRAKNSDGYLTVVERSATRDEIREARA